MVILVTGANSQLGIELKNISLNYPEFKFIFTTKNEFDITNLKQLKDFLNNSERINYIINTAAYTNVDMAETDQKNAYKVNVEGVVNLFKVCSYHKINLIHISTDYVFDGNKNFPYTEEDTTNPLNYYGKTKEESEKEALRLSNSIIIRTSWLYSPYKNNFVKNVIRKAKEQKEIEVVIDQIGSPTYALDLAEAIINIIKYSSEHKTFKRGIYHYSNEGLCSWFDFASEIIDYYSLPCIVKPILSTQLKTNTKRPLYSVLSKEKIKKIFNLNIPYWKKSLYKCLERININEI